jgi:hypothetical protein
MAARFVALSGTINVQVLVETPFLATIQQSLE